MINPERKSELVKIVKRVLRGNASPEERHFLEKYYDYFARDEFEPEDMSDIQRKILEDKIQHQIYLKTDPRRKQGERFSFRNKWFKAAAAVAILMATIGLLYRSNHNSMEGAGHPVDIQHAKNDIEPGGNKAILILSGGTRVLLDSADNGLLARQGNISLSKVGAGQVTYTSGNADNTSGKKGIPSSPNKIKYNTLRTPRGGQYQITLSDGTKVWLNAASSLVFPTAFNDNERKVVLTGEAYFEVAKNKNQPFKVETSGMSIEVMGTHFNVNAYSDEPIAKTTLLEGAVKVIKGNSKVLLQPGQQAIINRNRPEKINVSKTDTDEAIAWKNGYFSFHRTNIYEIMRQISRWYNVKVSYPDSLHVSLNGNISRNVNVSEVFKLLEIAGGLKCTMKGEKIIVRK